MMSRILNQLLYWEPVKVLKDEFDVFSGASVG